jgi:hypothetical protein
MSIIIDPEWTFIDTLKAAWKAYPGGKELGAPNRIRCLERWANVVGCERVVHELNTVLSEYSTYKEAAKDFGMSDSTLRRIRKNFQAMPSTTYFSSVPSKIEKNITLLKETEGKVDSTDKALQRFIELAQKHGVDSVSRLIEILDKGDIESLIHENTLHHFLEMSQRAGIDVISRLVDWITSIADVGDIITVLENLKFNDLQKLNAAIGLSSLKKTLSIWQTNTENDNEEFWQQTLSQNSFIFAQLFSFPVIVLEDKAYVGGKNFSNKGGNIVDFLCANGLTRNAALIEIKTPRAKLLGSQYRGDIYNVSTELSGSVLQASNYKKSLLQNYNSITSHEEELFNAFNPKSIIIMGNIQSELVDQRKKKSFELFRTGLSDVQVITYDELFGKVEFLVALLQGDLIEDLT